MKANINKHLLSNWIAAIQGSFMELLSIQIIFWMLSRSTELSKGELGFNKEEFCIKQQDEVLLVVY